MNREIASELGKTLDHLSLDIKINLESLEHCDNQDWYQVTKPITDHVTSQIKLRDKIKVILDEYTESLLDKIKHGGSEE